MRYYETLYVVHPDYEEDRLSKLQSEVDARVAREGGSIINSHVWGKRKLAYPVDKLSYGTYILLQYETDKPFVSKLNSWLELHEAILAYLTVRLEEQPSVQESGKSAGAAAKATRGTA